MLNRGKGDAGFTLPEVMVAALVLVTSILSTAMLADVGNQMTSRAEANSAATNISRAVSEAARSLTTTQLEKTSVLDSLKAAAPNLPDSTPADPSWTVEHRGATYMIAVDTCTVDDPADGYAAPSSRDASYCAQPPASSTPDLQPDDYRRVNVAVTHFRRPTSRIRTSTTVSSGATSSLPLITDLKMRVGATTCSTECPPITSISQTQALFDAKTVNNPAMVNWLIDGRTTASCPPTSSTCTGSLNTWGFTWNLGAIQRDLSGSATTNPNYGKCVRNSATLDGVYRVGIQGQDRNGASGGAASLSISLNRCAPLAPPAFNATGRNANGAVDVEWQDNSEGDILGYRVYRGTSTTQRTPICPATTALADPETDILPIDAPNECLDTAAPNYTTSALYYGVYAVDRDPSGNLREGAVSFVNVNSGNRAPNAPTNFTATKDTGGKVTLSWNIPATQDPDNGDRIESFRIYRRAGSPAGTPTYANRYDREIVTALCTAGACKWVDPNSQGSSNSYWLTSVDLRLRESAFTAGRQP